LAPTTTLSAGALTSCGRLGGTSWILLRNTGNSASQQKYQSR
jgi:hypothetical protein